MRKQKKSGPKEMDARGVAWWLSSMTGDAIYGHESLHELERFGVRYNESAKSLRTKHGTVKAPVYAANTFRTRIRRRGLGGDVAPGNWRGVAGLDLAEALCKLAGAEPKRSSRGRPFTEMKRRFNACVRALEEV